MIKMKLISKNKILQRCEVFMIFPTENEAGRLEEAKKEH